MASTKYRKRAKSTDPIDKGTKTRENDTGRAYSKILDAPRTENVDEGSESQNSKPSPLPPPAPESIQAPSETAVQAAEVLLDKVRIEDERNCFEIRLTRKANRLTRICLYFNGIEIKPHTYGGANAGSSYFNLLKNTTKKG